MIDSGALDCAIQAAAAWLRDQTQFGGRFCYGYNRRGVPMQRYNVARHAGALYAMAQFAERGECDALSERFSSASQYLAAACTRLVPDTQSDYALWCDPEGAPLEAKLGAAGLALAAWCGVSTPSFWRPPNDVLVGIGRFLAGMQQPDGRFISKYHAIKGKNDRWSSLYYPGEAALGLVRLHAVDGDPDWLDVAEKALCYLAETRQASGCCYEPDHWALLATEAIWPLAMNREALMNHSVGVIREMLKQRSSSGALTACGRVTPTATRLEGLLAMWKLLPPDNALLATLGEVIPRAIAYLHAAQIRTGDHVGAFPRAPDGIDDARARELRIDYTQHAMSAMIAFRFGATHRPSA